MSCRKLSRWAALVWLTLAGTSVWAQPETPAGTREIPEVAAGDPLRGERLYIGTASFRNGGAPCLACHGIAGHGLGGSASYGVDLTSAYQDYGPEDLLSMLEDMPFPTMEPIYADRPLTPEERQDLTAFLAEVSGQTPAVAGAFILQGSIGAALLLAVMLAFGWRRLLGVRADLVEKTRQKFGGDTR